MASKQPELRLEKLVTHVVDWHNKNPLVRRISGLRVHTAGFVAVPYLAPPGTPVAQLQDSADVAAAGTLRQRAMERAGAGGDEYITDRTQPVASTPPPPPASAADAAFDEAFFAPYSAARLADWVARHGSTRPRIPRGASVRHIAPRADVDMNRVHWRWVLTAQVDRGSARIRLLVGAGDPPAVLGPRMWSPGRIVALLLAVAGVAGALAGLLGSRGGAAPAAAVQPALPAASAVGTVAPATPATPATPAAPAAPAASAPAQAAASAALPAGPAASRPMDVEPRLGQVELPSLGPVIDERRRQQQAARADAASAARAQAALPAYAVWTRVLRTRAETEQLADAMRDLLRSPEQPRLRVEVLAVGSDWRVVGWPYADKAQAEAARELLNARGMKVEVVEF
jgi:pyruvate/2-oxoglutarate dehydrogenase complex dihydrolipoamide acyltransferase (E2) component